MDMLNLDQETEEFYPPNPFESETDIQTFLNSCSTQPDHIEPEENFLELADWIEAILAVANIIVFIFSFCGNVGALLVLYQSRISKPSTKIYLISLAVCDLTLTLTSPTVDLSQLLSRYGAWVFGSFLCKVIPFMQTIAVMGVALFLVAIAAERYLHVVRAFETPSMTGKWKDVAPTVAVIIAWIFSIGIAIPNLWYYEETSFWTYITSNGTQIRPRNETCKTYYMCIRTGFDHQNIAYYSVLGLAALIPTIFFTFCYISIIIFVRRHARVLASDESAAGANRVVRSRRTLRLIMGLIFLNLFCRVPVWTFVVVTSVKEVRTTTVTLLMFYGFHLLSNINSLLNPFFYAIFNDSIRSTRVNPNTIVLDNKNEGCWDILKTCCYSHIKAASSEYFAERSKNNYDFTKHSKFVTSVSTQKFNVSDKNEFAGPKTSDQLTIQH